MAANDPDDDPFANALDEGIPQRRAPLTWRRPADGRPVYGIDPEAPFPRSQPPDFSPVIARLAAERLGIPVEAIHRRPPPGATAPAPPSPVPMAPPAAGFLRPPAPPAASTPWGPPPDPWFAWPRHQGPALTPEQEWAARGELITQFTQVCGGLPPAPPPPPVWQPPPVTPPPWDPPTSAPWAPPAEPLPDSTEWWTLAAFVAALPLPPLGLALAAVAYRKARATGRSPAPALVAGGLACAGVAGLLLLAVVALP